ASIVDLRYRMSEVLNALARRERVQILYHGKVKGIIVPAEEETGVKVADHPFFGLDKEHRPVEEIMDELRGGRHRDL
ncbi:MAG TPA: hypothetical protein VJ161_05790, partial [Geobacteraceae bacterium]|nr:hypothetical protein [Geobacteraceae bacterium]